MDQVEGFVFIASPGNYPFNFGPRSHGRQRFA
jgi:hypothetical protein